MIPRMVASILARDINEDTIMFNRMTDYLFLSSTTFHSAWISLLLVVATMSTNTAAAQPPQLAVANASVIDPDTAEASIQSTPQSFMPGPILMKGSAMFPVLIHWIVLIWKAAWL